MKTKLHLCTVADSVNRDHQLESIIFFLETQEVLKREGEKVLFVDETELNLCAVADNANRNRH